MYVFSAMDHYFWFVLFSASHLSVHLVNDVWTVEGRVEAVLAGDVPVVVAVQELELVSLCFSGLEDGLVEKDDDLSSLAARNDVRQRRWRRLRIVVPGV